MAQRPITAIDAKNNAAQSPLLEKIKIANQLYNIHDPLVDVLATNIDQQVSYLIGEIDSLESSKQDKLTIDSSVTSESTNVVQASAIYSYVGTALAQFDNTLSPIAKSGDFNDLTTHPTTYIAIEDVQNYAYSKTEVSTYLSNVLVSISDIKQFQYLTAESLPTADADTMFKIYLIPSQGSDANNILEEYITIDKGSEADPRYVWEMFGTTRMSLSGYTTTDDVYSILNNASYLKTVDFNTQIADYYTKDNVDDLLEGYQETLTFDSTPTENSTNPVTSGGVYTSINTLDNSAVKSVNGISPTNGAITLTKATIAYTYVSIGQETNQTQYTMYVSENTFTAVTKVNGESV